MISETAERDFQAVKALLQQEKLKEVYEAYEPVLRDMLSVFSEAEWFEFWKQNGELEEQPLRLHLAAWKGDCLEIGCYEEDVTEKLADFLEKNLPEKAFPPPCRRSPAARKMGRTDLRRPLRQRKHRKVLPRRSPRRSRNLPRIRPRRRRKGPLPRMAGTIPRTR